MKNKSIVIMVSFDFIINHLVQLNSIIGLSFGNKTIYRITALHYTNDTNT